MGKSKNNNKQNYEKIRQDIARQYNEKIKSLESENKKLVYKVSECEGKVLELEENYKMLKDTNKELMKMLDLSDEDLKVLVEKAHSMKQMSDVMGILNKMCRF